jgi:hypothetical protein
VPVAKAYMTFAGEGVTAIYITDGQEVVFANVPVPKKAGKYSLKLKLRSATTEIPVTVAPGNNSWHTYS